MENTRVAVRPPGQRNSLRRCETETLRFVAEEDHEDDQDETSALPVSPASRVRRVQRRASLDLRAAADPGLPDVIERISSLGAPGLRAERPQGQNYVTTSSRARLGRRRTESITPKVEPPEPNANKKIIPARGSLIRRNTDYVLPNMNSPSSPPDVGVQRSESSSSLTYASLSPRRKHVTSPFVFNGFIDDWDNTAHVLQSPHSGNTLYDDQRPEIGTDELEHPIVHNAPTISASTTLPGNISPKSLLVTNQSRATTPRNPSPRSGKHVVSYTADNSAPMHWSRGKVLGKGTYGEVFIAFDMTKGCQFAVKRINKGVAGDQSKLSSFEAEIKLMEDLKHPNIVQYICSSNNPKTGTLDIFLEYVAGGSLASIIKEHGKLNMTLSTKFSCHILAGIRYLHQRQIIHRAIKGANVLVTCDGVAKLADFGCSKSLEMLDTQQRDSTLRTMRGSVPWMAPEMIKSDYSYPADIWSFGATIIEMVSGKNPWPEHKELPAALFAIGSTTKPPPIPSEITGTQMNDFILCCCQVDPEQRATADELAEHPAVQSHMNK